MVYVDQPSANSNAISRAFSHDSHHAVVIQRLHDHDDTNLVKPRLECDLIRMKSHLIQRGRCRFYLPSSSSSLAFILGGLDDDEEDEAKPHNGSQHHDDDDVMRTGLYLPFAFLVFERDSLFRILDPVQLFLSLRFPPVCLSCCCLTLRRESVYHFLSGTQPLVYKPRKPSQPAWDPAYLAITLDHHHDCKSLSKDD